MSEQERYTEYSDLIYYLIINVKNKLSIFFYQSCLTAFQNVLIDYDGKYDLGPVGELIWLKHLTWYCFSE